MDRKQDTRNKIALGGLFIKAKIHDEDKAVLLGILTKAFEDLNGVDSQDYRKSFRAIGEEAFKKTASD